MNRKRKFLFRSRLGNEFAAFKINRKTPVKQFFFKLFDKNKKKIGYDSSEI